MNLSVIGYIKPSIPAELFIENIRSYGKDFWNNVNTNIFIRDNISKEVSDVLNEFNINYKTGINEFWIPTLVKLVEECKTDYFELLIEDKKITNIKEFIYSFETLEENNIDFMPTFHYDYMNALVELIYQYKFGYIESTKDHNFMLWGTLQTRFAKLNNFNQSKEIKKIINSQSSPYPVFAGGIFKKEFFLKTTNRVLSSEYWKEVIEISKDEVDKIDWTNPLLDWAKNPYLPHSYEVWWKHNEDIEELQYTMLVPKKSNSIANDPKDTSRTSFKDTV